MSLTALNISNNTVSDVITYPIDKTQTMSPELGNIETNIRNLKSLFLQEPQIPLSVLFDSNPLLQHLDIALDRVESFVEVCNILSRNTTLRITSGYSLDRQFVFHEEVGKSLQLMLSSNQTLHCLEIKKEETIPFLLVLPLKYLTAGLRENNILQELDIDITTTENIKEFFKATKNLKLLAVSFYELLLWKISDEKFASLYYEEIIPHVTNMLKRNEDMKFLKLSFHYIPHTAVTYKEDWIPVVHQFWETVLLHSSLHYIYVDISNQFMIDILNDMKKILITQRVEKKLGPLPLVETRMEHGYPDQLL